MFQRPPHSVRRRLSAVLTLLGSLAATPGRAQMFSTNQIPPLAPPAGELGPGFWEQHGLAVTLGGLVVVALAIIAAWRLTRPKPPVIVPPAEVARTALRRWQSEPETSAVLSEIARVTRKYFRDAYGPGPGECTTAELCAALTADSRVGPELATAAADFLRACDARMFGPTPAAPAPVKAAQTALALVEQSEQRRTISG